MASKSAAVFPDAKNSLTSILASASSASASRGRLLGIVTRIYAELFPQLAACFLLLLSEGKNGEPGENAMLSEDACRAQRAGHAGLRDFVVLADEDRLHAGELWQQPFPIRFADLHGDRRHHREPVLHQGNAIRDALGDDDPLRARQQHVLVVEDIVPDARRNMAVVAVIADGELLVLRLLPLVIRRPRRPAADHEYHVAAAPVGKNDPAIERRNESVLGRRPECRRRRQFAHREGAGTFHQQACRAWLAVVGKADLQPLNRLLADPVLVAEPAEDFSIPDQPLMVDLGQRG